MTSLDQARQFIAGAIEPLPPVRMPLAAALGAVLREAACAREDVPAFARSAMDGYAIIAGDPSATFKIIDEVRPGSSPAFTLHPGECARIFTGAEIPPGATQVLRQEDVHAAAGQMTPSIRPKDAFIREKGEDARAGDRLIAPGQRLGPAGIALLATLGIVQPLVSPRPSVAHFATGDELVDPSESPGPSCLRDSNSSLVRAFAESEGATVIHQERVPDDPDLLAGKLRLALDARCDLLLISGGASVGAYDFGRAALEGLGFTTHFGRLNLRPGKPLVFATRGRQAAFVIPGNPLSHLALLHCIIRAAFQCLAGEAPTMPVLNARLLAGFHLGGDGRDTLWPARVDTRDGEPVVSPLRWQSSGDITGLAGLNAFIRCSLPALDTGARVPCILLHG